MAAGGQGRETETQIGSAGVGNGGEGQLAPLSMYLCADWSIGRESMTRGKRDGNKGPKSEGDSS